MIVVSIKHFESLPSRVRLDTSPHLFYSHRNLDTSPICCFLISVNGIIIHQIFKKEKSPLISAFTSTLRDNPLPKSVSSTLFFNSFLWEYS